MGMVLDRTLMDPLRVSGRDWERAEDAPRSGRDAFNRACGSLDFGEVITSNYKAKY